MMGGTLPAMFRFILPIDIDKLQRTKSQDWLTARSG
jgi:hypothetical protein